LVQAKERKGFFRSYSPYILMMLDKKRKTYTEKH
jgi:hypothetical protein